jgi:predicted PurR-regulated permease PerM
MSTGAPGKEKSFNQKVWTASAIVALFVILIWILKTTFNVLLLLLAGALIAIYFKGLAGLLEKKLKFPKKVSLPFAVIFSLVLLGLFLWFAGSSIQKQVSELSQTLPAAIDSFKQKLNETTIGKKVLEQTAGGGNFQKASGMAQTFFRSTFGVLGDLYVVLFLGHFLQLRLQPIQKGF